MRSWSACASSMRIASSIGAPHCSYEESLSSRRQRGGSAASSWASTLAAASAPPGSVRRLARPMRSASSPLDAAAGEDEVERVAVADQARQANGAAVDERHAPAPAEHAEHRVARRDPQVAPERELEAARHRVALDRGDHRLGEQHARRAHRPVAVFGHRVPATRAHTLQVGARAERAAGAGEDRDRSRRRHRRRGTRRRAAPRSAGRRRCAPRVDRWSRS